MDALIRLARAMAISADALLFDEDERQPGDALRLHFEAVSKLPPEEQDTIINVIDGLLIKHEAQRWGRRASGKQAAKKKSRKHGASWLWAIRK